MTSRRIKSSTFFLYYSIALLFVALIGFGVNALLNYEKLVPASVLVIAHGISMFTWYVLVILQSRLIKKGNYKTHISLGKTSVLLAVAIVISGFWMSLDFYKMTKVHRLFTINLFLLINFIVLYSLALYYRKIPDKHKRFILFAGISMMIPALARIARIFGYSPSISFYLLLILLAVPIIYDYWRLHKIHTATILGVSLNIVNYYFATSLISSEKWVKLLDSTIG